MVVAADPRRQICAATGSGRRREDPGHRARGPARAQPARARRGRAGARAGARSAGPSSTSSGPGSVARGDPRASRPTSSSTPPPTPRSIWPRTSPSCAFRINAEAAGEVAAAARERRRRGSSRSRPTMCSTAQASEPYARRRADQSARRLRPLQAGRRGAGRARPIPTISSCARPGSTARSAAISSRR